MAIQITASDKWRWLCVEGLSWVKEAVEIPQESDALRILRRKLNPWQAAMVCQQLNFRRRARLRFPNSNCWLWTDRSLQQASDWKSAVFKAQLIPENQLTIDACCGAGADLVALAQRFTARGSKVLGIDCDPQLAKIARANLEAHGVRAEVIAGSFPDVLHDTRHCWIHIDPDRRPADRRTTKIEFFSPPLESFLPLVESAVGAMIKLAPATELLPPFESFFQRGWIGNGRECRQQLLVRGIALSQRNERFAALCDDPDVPQLFFGPHNLGVTITSDLKDYVFECHAVLHASGLHTAWATRQDLEAIESTSGYFTGHQAIDSPWVQSFRVLEVLSWDQRKIKQWLRRRGIGIVEVKKRLIELDANRLQRELSKPAGERISLLFTKLAGRRVAIACQRLPSDDLTEN